MNIYIFIAHSGDEVLSRTEHVLADDLDALDLARAMSEFSEIDVWQDERMVAHLKRNDDPASVADHVSG